MKTTGRRTTVDKFNLDAYPFDMQHIVRIGGEDVQEVSTYMSLSDRLDAIVVPPWLGTGCLSDKADGK